MTKYEEHIKEVIKEWARSDDLLEFATGMDISGFTTENGERVIYLANGLYNIADGYRLGEYDGDDEREIIDFLEGCGIEFEGVAE